MARVSDRVALLKRRVGCRCGWFFGEALLGVRANLNRRFNSARQSDSRLSHEGPAVIANTAGPSWRHQRATKHFQRFCFPPVILADGSSFTMETTMKQLKLRVGVLLFILGLPAVAAAQDPASRRSVHEWVFDLRDPDPAVQLHALQALSEMEKDAAPAVKAVAELLANRNDTLRRGAAYTLARIGAPAAEVTPAADQGAARLEPGHSGVRRRRARQDRGEGRCCPAGTDAAPRRHEPESAGVRCPRGRFGGRLEGERAGAGRDPVAHR